VAEFAEGDRGKGRDAAPCSSSGGGGSGRGRRARTAMRMNQFEVEEGRQREDVRASEAAEPGLAIVSVKRTVRAVTDHRQVGLIPLRSHRLVRARALRVTSSTQRFSETHRCSRDDVESYWAEPSLLHERIVPLAHARH